jgi:hypothetical protein
MHATGGWKTIDSAPREQVLELLVGGLLSEPLGFPCRLTEHGWTNAATNATIAIEPTHWREWRRHRKGGSAPALHRINAMLIGRELSARHTAAMDPEIPEQLSSLLDRLAEREGGDPGKAAKVSEAEE